MCVQFGYDLLSLRTKDASDAASLSGMSQSVGYLLAATGPTLFGLLHDVTASWNLPISLLLMVSILLFIFGLGASKITRYKGLCFSKALSRGTHELPMPLGLIKRRVGA